MKSIRAFVVATSTSLLCLNCVQGARAIQEFSAGTQISADQGTRVPDFQEPTRNSSRQDNGTSAINPTRIPRSTPRNPTVQSTPIQRTPVAPERQLGLPPSPRGSMPPASEQRVLPPPVRIPAEPVRPLSTPQRTEPRIPQLTPPRPLEPPMEPRPNVVPPAGFRAPPPPPVTPLQPARR